jgi:hypothetical protein
MSVGRLNFILNLFPYITYVNKLHHQHWWTGIFCIFGVCLQYIHQSSDFQLQFLSSVCELPIIWYQNVTRTLVSCSLILSKFTMNMGWATAFTITTKMRDDHIHQAWSHWGENIARWSYDKVSSFQKSWSDGIDNLHSRRYQYQVRWYQVSNKQTDHVFLHWF